MKNTTGKLNHVIYSDEKKINMNSKEESMKNICLNDLSASVVQIDSYLVSYI